MTNQLKICPSTIDLSPLHKLHLFDANGTDSSWTPTKLTTRFEKASEFNVERRLKWLGSSIPLGPPGLIGAAAIKLNGRQCPTGQGRFGFVGV